jgi:preprotein translocase subunit SecG
VEFLAPYRQYFQIIQIIVGVALVISILLQARGSGLGSVFGGTGTVFKTRRGIDRLLFRMTIGFIILLAIVSFIGAAIPASQ